MHAQHVNLLLSAEVNVVRWRLHGIKTLYMLELHLGGTLIVFKPLQSSHSQRSAKDMACQVPSGFIVQQGRVLTIVS